MAPNAEAHLQAQYETDPPRQDGGSSTRGAKALDVVQLDFSCDIL